MTTQVIEELKQFAKNSLHGQDLRGFAAEAAAAVLLQNWSDALSDGNTDNLVADVDQVIDHLRTFQARAKALLPASNGGMQ